MDKRGLQHSGGPVPEGGFATTNEPMEIFELGMRQYLQYAKISATIREICSPFLLEPQKSNTLNILYNYRGSRRLVSHIYKALREDYPGQQIKTQERSEATVLEPLTEGDWDKINEGVKKVSTNAQFQLTQYNYVHQLYLTPKWLHVINLDRDPECPRCGGLEHTSYIWSGTVQD